MKQRWEEEQDPAHLFPSTSEDPSVPIVKSDSSFSLSLASDPDCLQQWKVRSQHPTI